MQTEKQFDIAPGAVVAKHTIYVFVRTDISVEQQMVQAAHAAAEAGRKYYRPEHGIASLIVLAAGGPLKLEKARMQLLSLGIEHDVFFEPDWNMGSSAVGTRPLTDAERPLLRGWQLWRPKASSRAEVAA